MVVIRLARHGAKKHPHYHIVVAHSEAPRDGRFLERIGTYDPARPMADALVDRARLQHWLDRGARPSPTVARVLREHARALAAVGRG
ncbi:MAG: 30S ribosomal protein S16 [Myxococcota bacterium]|nr:30S ribosomal protein S16 [Myxococcota bacterium]MDW8360875.1 30S ribosomal protein S16 [Myxococcales bacterium]